MSNSDLTHSFDQRMLAHDVRHLLALVQGHAELIEASLNDFDGAEEAKLGLGAIQLAVLRATDLCDDTMRVPTTSEFGLDWRTGAELEQILPFSGRIAELVRSRAIQAGVGFGIEVDPLLSQAQLQADAMQAERAILNLGWNALEAVSPEGGVIELIFSRDGDWIEVCVRDNGPGLPRELVGSLLDHASPEDDRWASGQGGSVRGLGLVIVAMVAKQHGGTLDGKNLETGGAEMRLRLPLQSDETER